MTSADSSGQETQSLVKASRHPADNSTDPPSGRASLSRALLWFAVSYGGAMLGYLVVNAFAGRLLTDSFGYFVIAVTVSTLLGQLGLMGVHRGGLREAARLGPGDVEGLRELKQGVRAVSFVMLPATAVLTAIGTFLAIGSASMSERWSISVIMGVLVWIGGEQKLWANYLRGFGQVRFASLLEGRSGGALASACQGLLIGGVLLLQPSWGLTGALGALAVGYALPVFVAWRRAARIWKHVKVTGSVFRDVKATLTRYWRFASYLIGSYLNSTIEIWVAAVVLTGLDLSLFSAAQRLSVLLAVPLASIGVVFSPVISRLVGRDDKKLERLLRTGASMAALLTAAAWIPMLVAPGEIMSLIYGPGFAAGALVLFLLTLASIGNVATGMCGIVLTMSRHEKTVARIHWAAVAVRIPTGIIAGLFFGATGLGVSAVIVTTGLYVGLWAFAHRRLGVWTHPTLRPSFKLLRQTSG